MTARAAKAGRAGASTTAESPRTPRIHTRTHNGPEEPSLRLLYSISFWAAVVLFPSGTAAVSPPIAS